MPQIPPFCPNRACPNHHVPAATIWFIHFGSYHSKAHGRVSRFACRRCGKSFSEQTFRLSYYLHRTIDFKDLFYRICACTGIRAIARSYGVTDKVISNRVGRLARQAMGMMSDLRPFQWSSESVAADGFESFIRSQNSPNNIHHLIGTKSQYVHACDLAHLRRKGRMTAHQKHIRQRLEQSDPGVGGEVARSFERICYTLRDLAEKHGHLVLHTDEKREYKSVLDANRHLSGMVRHITTSSRKARTYGNPLWPVNYYDRELRKDQANHVRETVRPSQEANNCMERAYLYAGFHNFFKPFRIKERDTRTHAEMAGFDVPTIGLRRRTFFTRRYFFSRVMPSASEWLVWLRAYRTPFRDGYQELPAYVTGEVRVRSSDRVA